jgi:hypothetical protein
MNIQNTELERILMKAEECMLIAKLAIDSEVRKSNERLAASYFRMADELDASRPQAAWPWFAWLNDNRERQTPMIDIIARLDKLNADAEECDRIHHLTGNPVVKRASERLANECRAMAERLKADVEQLLKRP